MDHEITILNLRRQLLVERVAFAAIALILMACWTIGYFRDAKSMILVDGKPVACVPSASDANAILKQIKSSAGCNPSEISFKQDVRVARAPRNVISVSRSRAYRAVLRVVSPVVPKWAIIVDGRPIVGVPSREVAGAALEAAKLRYGRLAGNLAEEPQFKENVTVDITGVDPSTFKKTAAEAVAFMFSDTAPVSKEAIYTVREGDLAGSIAARYGLELADMEALNPGLNLDRLQIDDKLRVKTTTVKPKLTVLVRDMSERTESFGPPVQRVSSSSMYVGKSYVISPGSAGRRKVRVETIYENGRRIGSETVDEEILREPVPRRVAMGIKARR